MLEIKLRRHFETKLFLFLFVFYFLQQQTAFAMDYDDFQDQFPVTLKSIDQSRKFD